MAEQDNTSMKNNNRNIVFLIVGTIVMVVILLAIIGGIVYSRQSNDDAQMETQVGDGDSMEHENEGAMMEDDGEYKDGTYTAVGEYLYHSGSETVGVTVTLVNGTIDEIELDQQAVHAVSKKMQADFGANYEELVVGKSIDEVELSVVSGSSLTSGGFNDAIDQIKDQANL